MTPAFEWTKDDVQTIKAAWADDHGRLALLLIVNKLAGIHSSSFSSDALQMAFNEGRRFVARELTTAINLPVDKIVRETDVRSNNRPLTATERAERAAAADYARSKPGA